ncbi:MAG: transcriptional regulator, partial [Spirochaetaceae bacterium]|nr:transcriptional regulator [Spirochaetaceae bacterium]
MSLQAQTEDDFYRARNKALFNEIQHFVNQEESHLLSFNDVKQMLKPQNEVYLGMQVVPINLIAGSEGRYYDFDNHFFPKNIHLKTRWERIDEAHLTDVILPPIKLYEIGGLYFVRDGNHRVSVARSKGVECIDAEVVSLKSEIKLKPGMTKAKILKEVINYEKR